MNLRWLLIACVLVLVTALLAGGGFGAALWWGMGQPDPVGLTSCPDGTALYQRTEVWGKVLVPIYHCFDDAKADDPTPLP